MMVECGNGKQDAGIWRRADKSVSDRMRTCTARVATSGGLRRRGGKGVISHLWKISVREGGGSIVRDRKAVASGLF